ncbi:bifunctional diguanylate cyclase/phosphodiesterase [Pseudomonas helleri]|uniref:cyclic-guanylate-specific phosphodiesterase n=1 Tax=Pseudomonas helleri TaxID=1608996 RepID=A0A6A7YVJ9_9PSED|nr:EAL domain-containing protein [Pseudomonas helleri]MQT26254.1 EAL domain-containing protein [Pseudomonas helleri]MQT79567.1 EAL domain-containing protein [Pseudomonas helleri]MQU16053.1 EAL domain-containing protein [Pseudomonas helleri]MQU26092.1 EAL domain-containing protein [Pseudomonas helleri]
MSRSLAVLFLSLIAWTTEVCALTLTDEEQQWLEDHPQLRLGIDATWPPFEFRNQEGLYTGLAADYVELIEERLGVTIKPVEPYSWSNVLEMAKNDKVDWLPGIMSTPERQKSLAFTRPYLDFPIVILAHKGGAAPQNIKDLYGLKVAVVENYAPHELLQTQHPDLNIVALPNVSSALQALATDQVDAMVGDLASSVWSLRQLKLDGLYVSGETPYRYQLAMAVPKDQTVWLGILDKVLTDISPSQTEAIQERWIGSTTNDRALWHTLMLYVLPGILLLVTVLVIVIRINRRLSSEISRRIALEQELRSSEYHYRGLVESLSAIAWEARLDDYIYTYVSPQAEALLGYPLTDWLTDGFWNRLLHPDDLPKTQAYCDEEISAGRDHSVDYRVITAQGETLWLKDIISITTHNQQPVLRGLMINISQAKQTEEALRLSEEKFAKAFHASPDGLLLTRQRDGLLIEVNEGFSHLSGYSSPDVLYRSTLDLKLWVDLQQRIELLALLKQQGYVRDFRCSIRHKDGRIRLCEVSSRPLMIGVETCMLTIARDITERHQMQEKLLQTATVFQSTAEGIVFTDLQQTITAVNRAFTEITGYSESEALGQTPRILASGLHDSAFYIAMWHQLSSEGHWQGEICNKRKNGETYPCWMTISAVRDSEHQITHFVAVFADISSLKHAQDRLDHQAHHDPLTNLPNRLLFENRLQQALSDPDRYGQQGAVLFLDLDRFKNINDSLGHPIGDLLLKAIALRLKEQLRDIDTVARQGGDEFIILLPALKNPSDAELIANKLLACFNAPFVAGEHELFISASIGASIYPDDGTDVATLVKNADAAMYRSKLKGRNRIERYTHDLTAQASARVLLEQELRRALERGQLSLSYQPKISLKDHSLVGAEALIRWNHPELGNIPPDRFIVLAEENGMIIPIGDWVLEHACHQLNAWKQIYEPFGPVSVNLSGTQLRQPALLARIQELLTSYSLEPGGLQLEITENFIMSQTEEALDVLHKLKQMGVQLAIDDFGTGYSSLSYLKRLPLNTLKIDQSFIRGLPDDVDDVAIVRAIIALGRSMQLTIIAEGVETQAQQDFLAKEGCEQIQGYIVSVPLSADEFAASFLRMSISDFSDSTGAKPSL